MCYRLRLTTSNASSVWCKLPHTGCDLKRGTTSAFYQVYYIEHFLFAQALGALPYIVALDHDTKSVVVSIRGSVSTADWVTDMLGVPERLDEWIPDSFREVRSCPHRWGQSSPPCTANWVTDSWACRGA